MFFFVYFREYLETGVWPAGLTRDERSNIKRQLCHYKVESNKMFKTEEIKVLYEFTICYVLPIYILLGAIY